MAQNLQAERVQEQVFAIDNLIEVKARLTIFRNNRLFQTLLLFQRFYLIQLLRVDKGIVHLIF